MKEEYKKVDGFGERLERLRKQAKLSRADVCNMLGGLAISTLQAWEGGTREPPISKLLELANIFKTNPNYLLTGNDKQIEQRNIVQEAFESLSQKASEHISMIQSYSSINVSAGFGSFNEGVTEADGEEPYSDNLLQQLRVRPHHCAVFWANGNSMLPTIASDDQLLVDLSKKEIKGDDKIYLVQNGSSVWVKRVKQKWNSIELISDNKEEYEPIVLTEDEAEHLQIIGQVVHIGHSLV